jgi:hypothetical protein
MRRPEARRDACRQPQGRPYSPRLGRCVACDLVDEIEIRFTETEVAQILWVLSEAAEHAIQSDALASLALIEETLRMVRDRFDRRRPES